MSERHSVDFVRASFNVVSDAEKRTITLQFDHSGFILHPISPPVRLVLRAFERRYGAGILSRLNRWKTGETSELALPRQSNPHPENPDVFCFEIGVRPGVRMETALATVLLFLRQQPGYQRTFGPPLDRDEVPSPGQGRGVDDLAAAAGQVLMKLFERRRIPFAKTLKRRRTHARKGLR